MHYQLVTVLSLAFNYKIVRHSLIAFYWMWCFTHWVHGNALSTQLN